MNTFASQLRDAIRERDMTKAELAAASGIGRSNISQYCSGKNIPGEKHKTALAAALEVPVDTFGVPDEDDASEDIAGLKNVPVTICAKRLGVSAQAVRMALIDRRLAFGFAYSISGGKWFYHISPKKLDEYIGTTGGGIERERREHT